MRKRSSLLHDINITRYLEKTFIVRDIDIINSLSRKPSPLLCDNDILSLMWDNHGKNYMWKMCVLSSSDVLFLAKMVLLFFFSNLTVCRLKNKTKECQINKFAHIQLVLSWKLRQILSVTRTVFGFRALLKCIKTKKRHFVTNL